MAADPVLDVIIADDDPAAVVLVLHGGQQRSQAPVLRRHASWWRMLLIAKSLRGASARGRWEVVLLRNRVRGWNDPLDPSPVRDARWALERLRTRHPGRPIVLVGHSMGGRTACRVADDASVPGVVALAPWLPEGEPTGALTGRALHVLHGTADRWTSPALSRDFVERCREKASVVSWTSMPGVGHFMLRRVGRWNGFVEDSIRRILEDANSSGGAR